MHKREKNAKASSPAPIVFLLYCAIGLILSTILSFISALLISAEKLPADSITAVSVICIVAGVFAASLMSAKMFGRVMISALLEGLIFFALLYILGAIFFARFMPTEVPLYTFLSCLIGSVSGGIIAACGKKRRR